MTIVVYNEAPQGVDDVYQLAHGTVLDENNDFGVLGNDLDPEGQPLTATLVTSPGNGSLTFSNDGSFTYTPNSAFVGDDSFTYTVSDGFESSDSVTVTLSVENTNPRAADDAYTTLHDQTLTVTTNDGVLSNDSDADGDVLMPSLVSSVSNGSLTLNQDGSFSYTPNAGFVGIETFIYEASDGAGHSEQVVARIDVLNTAPDAHPDLYQTTHDQPLAVTAEDGLLRNDLDLDGDPLTINLVAGPTSGSITIDSKGGFTYTPNTGFSGSDSLTYTVSDGAATSDPVTVDIDVQNSDPDVQPDRYFVTHDRILRLRAWAGVLANDFDSDGDDLKASLSAGPANGSLTLNDDGSFLYTPYVGFVGEDTFTYSVTDGASPAASAEVTIDVVNSPPNTAPDEFRLLHDTTLTVSASDGVLANDWDQDIDRLHVTLVDSPSNGILTLSADGFLVYTPTQVSLARTASPMRPMMGRARRRRFRSHCK